MKKIFLLLSITSLLLQSCSSDNNTNQNNNSSTYFSQGEIITDIDGNSYPTIVTNCSNQTWMQKNLNVSHYRNGDIIPQVTDPAQWSNLTTGAWCYYEDNLYSNGILNGTTYGKLYNWYAVKDPRGLAPIGYHIPSDAEWTAFTACLGEENICGGKLKETGTQHWLGPNTGATNESGFTALPGGSRNSMGDMGDYGFWWTSSQFNSTNSIYRCLRSNSASLYSNNTVKGLGFSVRCIKD